MPRGNITAVSVVLSTRVPQHRDMTSHDIIDQALRRTAPHSMLALLTERDPMHQTLAGHCKGLHATDTVPEVFEDRADIAVLSPDWIAHTDESSLSAGLARLRDLLARSVLAVADDRAPLSPQSWIALGYRPLAHSSSFTLYGFDLYDYKERPEWLNARFWANPENFDRYRW
jgi:hypothetical protein